MAQLIRTISPVLLLMVLAAVGFSTATAAPPHPDLIERIQQVGIAVPYYLANLDQMRAKGLGMPPQHHATLANSPQSMAKTAAFDGEFRALALLVGFSDNPGAADPAEIDSLLFSHLGNTVRDYYHEVSYGQIDIVTVDPPTAVGWLQAPQSYDYYVAGANGTGSYPNNAQGLVEDLVDLTDDRIDFSAYDNDGDGYVDVLIVIHAGSGAEFTGSNDDIWSHEWAITPRLKDGVYISTYTIQPEYWVRPGDLTIGVCCHELAHGFGLPDLYDTDYSSNGVGKWDLMALGTWLGPSNRGGSPAHLSAWCKSQIGVLTPDNLLSNQTNVVLPAVEDSGVALRLWNAGATGDEYFLVENRRQTGYDSYLPGGGLLVWHIDEAKHDNTQEWYPGRDGASHPLVALEQADGLFSMEKKSDGGGGSDTYPGAWSVTSFNVLSTPSSNSYTDGPTSVSIENISENQGAVAADYTVGLSGSGGEPITPPTVPGSFALYQNYPNPFNPVTTIQFYTEQPSATTVEVLNVLGQSVSTLFSGTSQAGTNETSWDANDHTGQPVSSGVYFYRLISDQTQIVRKMMLVR